MRAINFEERFAELEERGSKMTALVDKAQPTEVHRRLVGVLHDVLGLVGQTKGDGAPTPILVAARMIRHVEGELLEGLAEVPEEEVRKILVSVRDRIDEIVATDHDPAALDRTDKSSA